MPIMTNNLTTQHVYPPIPDRSHDWCAFIEDEVCCDECGLRCGWGATEAEAIADWLENYGDDDG